MTVNGENYLVMLHELVVSQFQTKPDFDKLFFQQDGASPHYILKVRDSALVPQKHCQKNQF